MNQIYMLFFFLFGLLFGSFFNVVGIRVPSNTPFVNDRSHCPKCNHQLAWYELIPLLSYLLQNGKCRKCKCHISLLYPLIELLTGLLFLYSYFYYSLQIELIISLLLIAMLMIVLVSDTLYLLIPNKVLLFFLPIFFIFRMVHPITFWWDHIIGGLTISLLIAIIILVSRGGMGGGDMKLFGVLGIVLGLKKVLLTFFLACVVGAIFGGFLLLFKIVRRKQAIPFGPYIILASLISYFHGTEIMDWYFQFLL